MLRTVLSAAALTLASALALAPAAAASHTVTADQCYEAGGDPAGSWCIGGKYHGYRLSSPD